MASGWWAWLLRGTAALTLEQRFKQVVGRAHPYKCRRGHDSKYYNELDFW
jgi:hypothetical protein